MFANSSTSLARRRGIVLVVVLGMLGLMALIGVTFATFAGQSLIASRNFGQGVARPQPEALMDYALAQLINDTNNPTSALRGHSLLRDMYGNDSVFRGSSPSSNPAAETGGVLAQVYNSANGTYVAPQMSLAGARGSTNIGPSPTPFYNQLQFTTNIPTTGQYYGLDFTRWILKIPGAATANNATFGNGGVITADSGNTQPSNGFAGQTFEILEDFAPIGGVHYFTLSNNLTNPTNDPRLGGNSYVPSDWATFLYFDPNFMNPNVGVTPNMPGQTAYTFTKAAVSLAREWFNNVAFTLDGRNMRAFNGPGLTSVVQRTDTNGNILDAYPYNLAAYPNFRVQNNVTSAVNSAYKTSYPLVDPDALGMDEDYDACDLENWFLAIQSADGQVVVPSFHRPGILSANDWTTTFATASNTSPIYGAAKILRPRLIDNSPLFPPDPSTPDSNHKLTYDIDNDGDGVTDSVWLDLGYSVQRDPGGKLYKPLFAFMILGLNGRLPLNTVGNLQDRANPDNTNNGLAANSGGQVPSATTGGQVPYPGFYTDANNQYYKGVTVNGIFGLSTQPAVTSSQTYYSAPLWDHASHLGFSVNEINPKYALQNAPSNAYGSTTSVAANSFQAIAVNVNGNNYSQVDNAGVSVALTQMRNILAGTIPTDLTYPYAGTYPLTANNALTSNGDANAVMVNGQYMILPNNMADAYDLNPAGTSGPFNVFRALTAVPGRWGEATGIQLNSTLPAAGLGAYASPVIIYPNLIYNNPVRAGRSIYTGGTNDFLDDDLDGTDPIISQYAAASLYYREPVLSASGQTNTVTVTRSAYTSNGNTIPAMPEFVDTFDTIGQRAVATERIRQFVTPIDPSGSGRLIDFNIPPNNDNDYGTGYDGKGRVSYYRYFRPAGMPQDVRYPYGGTGSTWVGYPYFPTQITGAGTHRFLMPQLFPAGSIYAAYPSTALPATGASDIHNNRYHGFQAMLTPELAGTGYNQWQISAMSGMPIDWDNATATITASNTNPNPGVPAGYPNANIAYQPGGTNVGPPLGATFINNFAPTINPNTTLASAINTENGPNFGLFGNAGSATPTYPIGYGGYMSATDTTPLAGPVVNGYLGGMVLTSNGNVASYGGGLNKDEADEMNLYAISHYDQPFGPSDLEWLYRLQDVDGATLSSRLSQLAPVSFSNPADGLTRRRMFSTDTWEPTGWVYANDNPSPYAGAAYGASTDHVFTFNSRFTPYASPSLEILNQVDGNVAFPNGYGGLASYGGILANPITTEYLANPSLPGISPGQSTSFFELYPNSSYTKPVGLSTALDTGSTNLFDTPNVPRVSQSGGVVVPFGNNSMVQAQTPPLAHRDRRINLNYPLPISSDPGEPVRQKWVRETYTLLKAILPPASVDTPEELAALSQFVVNIIDFRDPDCSMTRFVNTDLIVTDNLTKTASNVQPTTGTNFDTTWNVSPPGVRFATSADNGAFTTTDVNNNKTVHFAYDPSLYSPDVTTPFLVQHGMEYNPIAINEVLGVQYGPAATNQGLFIELVNTLSEEQNNNGQTSNASAVSLAGWDLVITPDDFGWGRPDPISGEVSSIASPPLAPPVPPSTVAMLPPANTDPVPTNPLALVYNFRIPATANPLKAINGTAATAYVIGTSPAPTGITLNVTIPTTMPLPPFVSSNAAVKTQPSSGKGQYYWVYLRRPANPFDTAALVTDNSMPGYRPNREMVVVDAMRFPFIDCGPTYGTASTTKPYSARRLQPYRGGHLLPVATTAGAGVTTLADGTMATAAQGMGVTAISPPSPAHAYGFSEQTAAVTAASTHAYTSPVSQRFFDSIGNVAGAPSDTNWAHFPFNDRDFTSVAELLLVPGCPPGLFTKQFVEEPYPGNVADQQTTTTLTVNPMAAPTMVSTVVAYGTNYAAGTDDTTLNMTPPIAPPTIYAMPTTATASGTTVTVTTATNPYGGRTNFGAISLADFPVSGGKVRYTANPVAPAFPYLPDNFYYTAASIAPPASGGTYPTYYTHLTSEIGGWTGAGWHKMMEFFEVPSSANGAVGTADAGFNFDWARQDVKPGLLNLNLIIDEEVFAGIFDDPRLNEQLAAYSISGNSVIPYVVTQLDNSNYGTATASYPLSGLSSTNQLNTTYNNSWYSAGNMNAPTNNPAATSKLFGRGYVVRDPDSQNYTQVTTTPVTFPYQQLHGIKAAFSDFLKLRHGGSGFLFAHGAGPVGSGNQGSTNQPIAAERPYRSLSYPDISYTIMRPASLPPAPATAATTQLAATPGTPVLPFPPLSTFFGYSINTIGTGTFVQLNPPLAPRNLATPSQYVSDPGVKNPYLSVQYANPTDPTTAPTTPEPSYANAGPPYPVLPFSMTDQNPPSAPFPPPIPPTPAARLIQVPDTDTSAGQGIFYDAAMPPNVYFFTAGGYPSSNASVLSSQDGTAALAPKLSFTVNLPVASASLYYGTNAPPTLVPPTRAVFLPDNNTPLPNTTYVPSPLNESSSPIYPYYIAGANNYLGAGRRSDDSTMLNGSPVHLGLPRTNDNRQHPLYRTEWLQKVMNLTTVRTHQFAVWITIGFFEVVKQGTPELGIADVLGQELGLTAGRNTRYRSFFVLDRTKATGFNPYYPGNFRDCVTYRRRIE